jgi:peptide/nickel transport system substrate-binding protein
MAWAARLLAGASAAVLLAACGGASQPAQGAAGASGGKHILTVGNATDMLSMNPYAHSESTQYGRWAHIYEPLDREDPKTGQFQGVLAESWSNPDHNTWDFKMRQGVKFHDGSELTADDVVFSYTRMRTDKDSKQGDVFSNVDAIEAPDKYTVRIHTKTPDAAFYTRLAQRYISNKAHFDKLGAEAADKAPDGTGPFKFKEWVPGQRFVIEKNPDYWGADKPYWDEVVFRPIPEAEVRVTSLLNGETQIVEQVPPQDVERVQGASNVTTAPYRNNRLMFVALNPPLAEPLQNEKVRQAIAYAIDKDAIIKNVLQGKAYRLDQPIGEGILSYDDKYQYPFPYDPAKAKQLLSEAGYPNGFTIDFYSPVNRYPKDKDISTAITGMLAQIGIKTNLKTPEWATFQDEYVKGKYPMYLIGRGDVVDPSEYLEQYFMTGVTKRLQFSNPDVDAALKAQQQEFDPQKRLELLRKAEQLIVQQAPSVFLLQYQDAYGIAKNLNFEPRGDEMLFAWTVTPK